MVTQKSVENQLKKLKFNYHSWGRSEANELANILLVGEEIYEVVNGIYEAGFAMLVSTDIRILLVDKKPLNYLTVEDFRFDMINEIDYSHRLFGAHITVTTGAKSLKFTSYNQPRLRKLITHVQHCIAEGKKTQTSHAVDQKQHLEQINQQLQSYLLAQHQQQHEFQQQLAQAGTMGSKQSAPSPVPDAVKPSPELNDYLFAQSLLAQHKADTAKQHYEEASGAQAIKPPAAPEQITAAGPQQVLPPIAESSLKTANSEMAELYAEGLQEIYGKRNQQTVAQAPTPAQTTVPNAQAVTRTARPANAPANSLEINPLKIAYSKLPMALRNRRFGRPLFHSHAQADSQTSLPLTEN